MGLLKPCYIDGCGELSEQARCPAHRPAHATKGRKTRGYPWWWEQLSIEARQLQPFCSKCGSDQRLTVDHTPQAWQKIQAGHRLTLKDFETGLLAVLCITCNIAAGHARGRTTTRS
ncbi:hypothetical protein [Mycolicibacterium mengxianglii]|uniref:hypothetical protein n=1 Tax=Mycolicibacterium mengxianglii TaxID=2736649 RepID=UPI0018D10D16|nr:hypothetical protein [Mycolicibacterium mengxianglii]